MDAKTLQKDISYEQENVPTLISGEQGCCMPGYNCIVCDKNKLLKSYFECKNDVHLMCPSCFMTLKAGKSGFKHCPKCDAENFKKYQCNVCCYTNTALKHLFTCGRHYTCDNCFSNLQEDSKVCPECRKSPILDYTHPLFIETNQLKDINLLNVPLEHIFIHQKFKFPDNCRILTIMNKDTPIKLYCLPNGDFYKFKNLYVNTNGYLYDYDKDLSEYHPALLLSMFQLWNKKLVTKQV
jgi:hypothetical protein